MAVKPPPLFYFPFTQLVPFVFFILPGPGGLCVIWPGSAVLTASSLLFPLLFNTDEILVCVGGEYSIPILTSLPSGKFKKAVHTTGPFGWSSKVKCR